MPRLRGDHLGVEKKPVSAAFEIVAKNLDSLRSSHKTLKSQAAIAEAAKVDQKTVGRILNKTNEPSLEVLAKIAKAFGLAPWQMLVPDLEPTNPPMLASESNALKKLYANLGKTKEAIEGVLRSEGNSVLDPP